MASLMWDVKFIINGSLYETKVPAFSWKSAEDVVKAQHPECRVSSAKPCRS
jgi:hypothetical protein